MIRLPRLKWSPKEWSGLWNQKSGKSWILIWSRTSTFSFIKTPCFSVSRQNQESSCCSENAQTLVICENEMRCMYQQVQFSPLSLGNVQKYILQKCLVWSCGLGQQSYCYGDLLSYAVAYISTFLPSFVICSLWECIHSYILSGRTYCTVFRCVVKVPEDRTCFISIVIT